MTGTVLGALVSIAGALVAGYSAWSAKRSADGIDRRRHEIEHLDALADSFRNDYAAFMVAWPSKLSMETLTPMLFRAEILVAHPLTTPGLEVAVESVLNHTVRSLAAGGPIGDEINEFMSTLRREVKSINAGIVEKRRLANARA